MAQRIVKMKEEEEGFILNFPLEQQQQKQISDWKQIILEDMASASRPVPVPFPSRSQTTDTFA